MYWLTLRTDLEPIPSQQNEMGLEKYALTHSPLGIDLPGKIFVSASRNQTRQAKKHSMRYKQLSVSNENGSVLTCNVQTCLILHVLIH